MLVMEMKKREDNYEPAAAASSGVGGSAALHASDRVREEQRQVNSVGLPLCNLTLQELLADEDYPGLRRRSRCPYCTHPLPFHAHLPQGVGHGGERRGADVWLLQLVLVLL